MMKPSLFRVVVVVGSLGLASCTPLSPNPHAPFESVRCNVQDRSGHCISKPRRCTFCGKDQAQASGELSLDAAINLALLHNHHLHAAYERLGIAQADWVQSGLWKNPILDFSWKTHSAESIIEIGVVHQFLDLILKPQKVRSAQSHLQVVKAEVASDVLGVIVEVKRAYFTMAAARAALKGVEDKAEVLALAREVAQRACEAGNLSRLDVIPYRSAYQAARLEVAEKVIGLLTARESLGRVMGVDGEWQLADSLPEVPQDLDISEVEDQAIACSLDLQASRHHFCAMAAQFGVDVTEAILGDAALGLDAERETSGEWFVGPQFSVAIPLFDWGFARAAAGRAEMRKLWREHHALERDIRAAARVAMAELGEAHQRCHHFEKVLVPLADEEMGHTLLYYNAMQIGVLDLLLKKSETLDVREEALMACLDYWMAQLRVDALISGRWDG